MVEIANALAATLDRPLNWVHMPLAARTARRRRSSRRCATCAFTRRPSSTSGALHAGERSERDGARSRSRTRSPATSASRRRAAGAGCRAACVPALVAAHVRLSRRSPTRARERSFVFAWPTASADPGRGVGRAADRRVRAALRHGREPRLVPQPRPDRRAARARPPRRATPDRLLGRHRHPARPAAAADLRPPGRDGDRRQLAEVPARRARPLPRRRARRLPRGLRFLKDERRLQYVDEVLGPERSRGRRARLDERDPPLRRPRGHAAAWARVLRPGGRVRINSGNVRNPRARENEWIIDETVYVVHEVARASSAPTRAGPLPRRARRRGADAAPTSRAATASSSRRVRSTTTSTRCAHGGFAIDGRHRADDRGDVDEWFEFLPRTPTRCSAGSAARRRSTASRRRRRRRRPGWSCCGRSSAGTSARRVAYPLLDVRRPLVVEEGRLRAGRACGLVRDGPDESASLTARTSGSGSSSGRARARRARRTYGLVVPLPRKPNDAFEVRARGRSCVAPRPPANERVELQLCRRRLAARAQVAVVHDDPGDAGGLQISTKSGKLDLPPHSRSRSARDRHRGRAPEHHGRAIFSVIPSTRIAAARRRARNAPRRTRT